MRLARLLVVAALCGSAWAAPPPEVLRNWFDDPFFALTAALPDCPEPLGPFGTEAQRRAQAHHRAEKGTSCWLAGQCDKPNAYAYDKGIAQALREAFARHGGVEGRSSLWVTVQARVVTIEGCAESPQAAASLERLARSLPDVQQAIAAVRSSPGGAVPYPVRSGR